MTTTGVENNGRTTQARRPPPAEAVAPPENKRRSGGRRGPGGRFQTRQSGNAAGRPKGPGMTYQVRLLWAHALKDPQIRQMIVQKLRQVVTNAKTVVQALESAARINRENGSGSDSELPKVTIIFNTNLQPGRCRRPEIRCPCLGPPAASGPTIDRRTRRAASPNVSRVRPATRPDSWS